MMSARILLILVSVASPPLFSSDVILGGNSVGLSDVVKNLWLYVNGRLNWRKQVNYVCFSHFFHFALALSFSEIYVQGS
jgi:hypothetical protein